MELFAYSPGSGAEEKNSNVLSCFARAHWLKRSNMPLKVVHEMFSFPSSDLIAAWNTLTWMSGSTWCLTRRWRANCPTSNGHYLPLAFSLPTLKPPLPPILLLWTMEEAVWVGTKVKAKKIDSHEAPGGVCLKTVHTAPVMVGYALLFRHTCLKPLRDFCVEVSCHISWGGWAETGAAWFEPDWASAFAEGCVDLDSALLANMFGQAATEQCCSLQDRRSKTGYSWRSGVFKYRPGGMGPSTVKSRSFCCHFYHLHTLKRNNVPEQNRSEHKTTGQKS